MGVKERGRVQLLGFILGSSSVRTHKGSYRLSRVRSKSMTQRGDTSTLLIKVLEAPGDIQECAGDREKEVSETGAGSLWFVVPEEVGGDSRSPGRRSKGSRQIRERNTGGRSKRRLAEISEVPAGGEARGKTPRGQQRKQTPLIWPTQWQIDASARPSLEHQRLGGGEWRGGWGGLGGSCLLAANLL